MAAKVKRISVNAFEKAMKDTYTPVETFDWNGIEVTVKKCLGLKEMMEFVDSVVKSCFADNTGEYIPEIKDFATKVCILEKYANFTMPSNVESQYALIYQTDAVERVLGYVNPQQFNEVCVAIAKKVEHRAQADIEASRKELNRMIDSIDVLQEQMSALFAGVSADDIKAVAQAVDGGALDEHKIVRAYIDETGDKAGDE